MTKLRNGRWNHQIATVEEIKAVVKELREMVKKYHWETKKVAPYSFWITVDEFINNSNYDDVEKFNYTSRSLMIDELNGFIDIADIWEKQEKEPKVTIKTVTGKVMEVPKSTADEFIAVEFATLV